MELASPSQELCSNLKEAAALLKWAMRMVEHLSEAGFMSDAQALMAIISEFPDTEDKLIAYAKEVKAGQVTRARPEQVDRNNKEAPCHSPSLTKT